MRIRTPRRPAEAKESEDGPAKWSGLSGVAGEGRGACGIAGERTTTSRTNSQDGRRNRCGCMIAGAKPPDNDLPPICPVDHLLGLERPSFGGPRHLREVARRNRFEYSVEYDEGKRMEERRRGSIRLRAAKSTKARVKSAAARAAHSAVALRQIDGRSMHDPGKHPPGGGEMSGRSQHSPAISGHADHEDIQRVMRHVSGRASSARASRPARWRAAAQAQCQRIARAPEWAEPSGFCGSNERQIFGHDGRQHAPRENSIAWMQTPSASAAGRWCGGKRLAA